MVGSIPARAGQPLPGMARSSSTSVYPRACGATAERRGTKLPQPGLSPRVRGNPHFTLRSRPDTGSIPARAGQPQRIPPIVLGRRVYPRACGATIIEEHKDGALHGLSPRVRGNPAGSWAGAGVGGSIPARAGQPRPGASNPSSIKVYPRACGATAS